MSSVYVKGSKTNYSNRKNKVFDEGRTCSEKKCDVTLSKYNARTECYAHYKFKQPRIRGRVHPKDLNYCLI